MTEVTRKITRRHGVALSRVGHWHYVTTDGRWHVRRGLSAPRGAFGAYVCTLPHKINRGGKWYECGGGVEHQGEYVWAVLGGNGGDGAIVGHRTFDEAIQQLAFELKRADR